MAAISVSQYLDGGTARTAGEAFAIGSGARFPEKVCGIYSITNNVTGAVYIGQSRDMRKRWAEHKRAKSSTAIHNAIRKHGVCNFTFSVLEECEAGNLNARESHFVSVFDCVRPNGYNLTSGGDSPTFVSDETRKKQSVAKKGKPGWNKGMRQPEELLRRLSAIRKGRPSPMKGRTHTNAAKEKLSAAGKGRTPWNKGMEMTIEHREKLSNSHVGQSPWNKGVPISESAREKLVAWNTGRVIQSKRRKVIRDDGAVFDSVSLAAESIGVTHGAVCAALRGGGRKSGGFGFSYYSEESL